jgi:hypothetical protein
MLVLDASEREGASAKRRTGKTTACMPWLRWRERYYFKHSKIQLHTQSFMILAGATCFVGHVFGILTRVLQQRAVVLSFNSGKQDNTLFQFRLQNSLWRTPQVSANWNNCLDTQPNGKRVESLVYSSVQ